MWGTSEYLETRDLVETRESWRARDLGMLITERYVGESVGGFGGSAMDRVSLVFFCDLT